MFPCSLPCSSYFNLEGHVISWHQLTSTDTAHAAPDLVFLVHFLQHSYFNLAGHASGTILGHQLTLHGGDHYTPVGGMVQRMSSKIAHEHCTCVHCTGRLHLSIAQEHCTRALHISTWQPAAGKRSPTQLMLHCDVCSRCMM